MLKSELLNSNDFEKLSRNWLIVCAGKNLDRRTANNAKAEIQARGFEVYAKEGGFFNSQNVVTQNQSNSKSTPEVKAESDKPTGYWTPSNILMVVILFIIGAYIRRSKSGKSSSANGSRNTGGTSKERQSSSNNRSSTGATNSSKENTSSSKSRGVPQYWFQCKHCEQELKQTSNPRINNCPNAPFHQWTKLAEVGDINFQCSKCGVTINAKSSPSISNCPRAPFHQWTRL